MKRVILNMVAIIVFSISAIPSLGQDADVDLDKKVLTPEQNKAASAFYDQSIEYFKNVTALLKQVKDVATAKKHVPAIINLASDAHAAVVKNIDIKDYYVPTPKQEEAMNKALDSLHSELDRLDQLGSLGSEMDAAIGYIFSSGDECDESDVS